MGSIQPRPSQGFLQYLWLYNPVYLISSICMLASCVRLANDSVHSHVPLSQLLALVGTLVLYQVALFAIGAFLVLWRNILRDGRTLLILDAIFLSDITFVNSELITTRLSTGLAIGLLMVSLAAMRIAWISRRLQSPIPLHRYLLILLQIAFITLIPSHLKHIDTGTNITPGILYAMWWAAAILSGGAVIIDTRLQRAPASMLSTRAAWVQPTYLIAPFVALMLHLAVLHYVYNVTFYIAMIAPQLVALAMLLRRMAERHPKSFPAAAGCQLALLVLACLLGANAPSALGLRLGLSANLVLDISAAKMAFLALYVGVVYIYFRRHARWFLAAAAGAAALALFGPSPQQSLHALAAVARWILRVIACVIPSTRTGWGILGIVASFLLLGVGLAISLRRPPEDGDHHAPVPEPDPQLEHATEPQADPMPLRPPTSEPAPT